MKLEKVKKMSKETVQRKIANCIMASKRALDPSFRAYWKDTASKLATQYNVNLEEIKKHPEFYNAKASSMH